ncbi:hypothetical protein EX895_004066 [Sporisorium graminicola]|uniref:Zn(2)-C6 fungal-type domain-containing protein n=1 Tax=Sporisorium graminicola TaxID=280036 RepID=A0A4V6ETZ1_9BASI|nr:hypothetical protein EX895_004066 [Sporisorium graminicola]TKY87389.1 hypothetical protein EX895_004066 [Sporisorium graminicola]
MSDTAEASTSSNVSGKRKLYVACNACRFRKVKCDREPRLEQGYSACTNCEGASMDCVLTVNPPKKRLGKRMKMLQEQQEVGEAVSIDATETMTSSAFTQSNGQASHAPQMSSTTSFNGAIEMSPGFSSLLEAVSQQQGATFQDEPPTINVTTDGTHLPPYAEASDTRSSIIQNGMFAAFDTSNADVFRFSTGSTPVNELHGSSRQIADTSTGPTDPSSSSATPRSVTAAASDQSSPEVISSQGTFLSSKITNAVSTQTNALKRRNPFNKPSPNNATGQVGFVGGLLGIVSLDKQLLDVCVKAYFESIGQCIGFIRPEWFWPRYHAFFSRYSGLFVGSSADTGDEPLSELLLIAVACRGAGASQFANRFELQKDLYEHYCRLIKDRDRLVRDGFDALESVVLMVEYVDSEPKPIADSMSAQGVYDVDVLSHEGLIRLMKKLELQREKPFGVRLEGRDSVRQRILFWTIYVYDAIRSQAGRTTPLIEEDEISLIRSLPLWGSSATDAMRMAFRDYFVDLSNICRYVAYKIQSPRVQDVGIDPRDVLRVLDDLKAWHDQLGPLFTWDWNDMLHITGPTHPEDQSRRSFIIFLFLGQWLGLDYAVEEIGFSSDCDAKLKQEAIRRLEHEVQTTLDRQVLVCDHGTLFGIIRLHPDLMQSWSVTWAFWCIKRMQALLEQESEDRLASAKATQAFQRYQSAVLCFINAAASCDSALQTPERVQQLMTALKKVTEARNSTRLTFDRGV